MAKNALITGASGGIGADLARLFAADGHNLILVARSKDKLQALAAELSSAHGVSVEVIAQDLGQHGAAGKLFEKLGNRQIDFLVNNAGFGLNGPFAQNDRAREIEMLELNIVTLVDLTKLCLPGMLARKEGRILNVGSTAGFQPGPFMSSYYASKSYVNLFSEGLSYELRKTGVSVTVLCPGATWTDFANTAGSEKSGLFDGPLARFTVMKSAKVARIGYRAMLRGKRMVIAGFFNKVQVFSVRLGPRWLVSAIASSLNR